MNIKFENLQLADLEEVKNLYFQTIQNVCSNEYSKEQRNAWSAAIDNSERWLTAANSQYFLVAKIENIIVGFGTLKEDNYINFFYVHKDFQRQGIAKIMLKELEDKAKSKNQKIISSDISETAKPFFQRHGFIVVAKQSHIRNDVELINYKMVKEL